VLTYTLLQIPAALLVALLLWWARIKAGLDLWLAWIILVAWVAKDVVLFFFLWPAYDSDHEDYYSLSGLSGTALEPLDPEGTVRVRGQTWKARSDLTQTIPAGRTVRVVDRQGLTLVVRPDEETR
jgi:membrane-bound ClpP family serine protease